jgi:hypothetical protein
MLLTALCVIPLLMYLMLGNKFNFYISESFRGFFNSRNDIGVACGFALLLSFMTKNKILRYSSLLLAVCLSLVASRSAMIAFTVSAIYLSVNFLHRRNYSNLILLFTVMILLYFSLVILEGLNLNHNVLNSRLITLSSSDGSDSSVGLFQATDNRLDIYYTFLNEILHNFLFFGKGTYYSTVSINGVEYEAHNFFLQSILNFGLFVTLLWLCILLRFYLIITYEGRALLIFLSLFGFFQPGFDAFLFLPVVFMGLTLAHR